MACKSLQREGCKNETFLIGRKVQCNSSWVTLQDILDSVMKYKHGIIVDHERTIYKHS